MDLPTAVQISQLVATLVVAVALLLNFQQLSEMRKQIDLSKSGQIAQGTMEPIKYVTSPEVKAAERHIDALARRPYDDWDDNDRSMLTTWCNAFDIAGIFIRRGLADEGAIVDNWGARIKFTYELASSHIDEARTHFATPLYWDDFEWLANRPSIQLLRPLSPNGDVSARPDSSDH